MAEKNLHKRPNKKFLVNHGSGYKFKIVFDSYIDICGGNWIAAALLAEIEQLQVYKTRKVKLARKNKSTIPSNWIYFEDYRLKIKLKSSKSAIQRALNLLEELNFIQVWYYGGKNKTTDSINYITDVDDLREKRKHKAKIGLNPEGHIEAKRWMRFNAKVVQYKVYDWLVNRDDEESEDAELAMDYYDADEHEESDEEIEQEFISVSL